MKTIIVQVLLMLAAITLLPTDLLAQEMREPCKPPMEYENRNQADYGPLSVPVVSGRVLAEVGDPARDIGPVPGACLSLFTEREHRFVASAVSDENGHFAFKSIRSGRYRLVVRAHPLCVANVPLRVVSWPRGGLFTGKRLVIHLRPAGIDRCSHGDYK
jgi:hypothetical protein